MRHDRILSAAELMLLPAGDRALRPRWLARWYEEPALAMNAAGSTSGATHHRNILRKVQAVAAQ